ncbi:NACHT domain-containing protein [Catenulispora subtropica]|uniref:NACHT domain-containing protein n=1 Tax=Catenulispora subtropica TaxID=450798 RepID=A0ABN2SKZ3_9ACTN
MVELASSALALGKIVGTRAGRAWLAAHTAESVRRQDLVELIQSGFPDQLHARKVSRQLDDIADQVARRVIDLSGQEYRGLPESDKAAAVEDVKDALAAADLSDAVLLAADADPRKLAAAVRAQSPGRGTVAQLGEGGARVYEVVLLECCECLIRIVRELAQFTPRTLAEVLSRLSEMSERVETALSRLPVRTLDAPEGTAGDEEFGRRYLEVISTGMDMLELFGVPIRNFRPRTSLTVGYISLSVSADERLPAKGRADHERNIGWHLAEAEPARATLGVEEALGQSRLTLVRGEAGSGKTTLLRWLAISAARGTFSGAMSDVKGYTPFLVRLRSYSDVRLPRPDELLENATGVDLSIMPRGWIGRRLASGRAMLLVDGVDELKANQRRAVREWLSSLLQSYPGLRVVVTSRPAAADAKWLDAEGFRSVFLERMSPADVKSLIRHWHSAVREGGSLPCKPEELPDYEAGLLARLETAPHLRALATSPLLAAMLCALNLDRRTRLPRNRMDLYSATLELLLERRDDERSVPSYVESSLDREERIQILQDLAWRLTETGRSELPKDTAVNRVQDRLRTMARGGETGESVLEHLLQRSGIVREPMAGRIDFVHRTVQEYLAAKQIADDADIEPLIAKAHLDQWRETIVMTVGHANTRVRERLLTGILARMRAEPKYARQLKLLAGACLETSTALSEELRAEIDDCLDDLIPPRDVNAARQVASLGALVLDRLPDSLDGLSPTRAAAVVHAACLINGPQALELLAKYARDPREAPRTELVAGWEYFDAETYAREVLAAAALAGADLEVKSARLLPHLHYLRGLTHLGVFCKVEDLGFLHVMEQPLRRLSTWNGSSVLDISPVERFAASLTSLNIASGGIPDLDPLLRLPLLDDLHIDVPGVEAIDFLDALPRLNCLTLRSANAVRSFAPISAQTSLTEIRLIGCPGLTDLGVLPLGAATTAFCISGAGLDCDLGEIVGLVPNVRNLAVEENQHVRDLGPVAGLDLEFLGIAGCLSVSDLSPLAGRKGLRTVYASRTGVSELGPLAGLPRLRFLTLDGCEEIRDLSPLAELASLETLTLRDTAPGLDLAPLAANRRVKIFIRRGQDVRNAESFGARLVIGE